MPSSFGYVQGMHALRVPGWSVRHGFFMRTGGISQPPWDSLNVGLSLGDAEASVQENWRRIAGSMQLPSDRLARVSQVHRAEVLEVQGAGHAPRGEADALWTREDGTGVGVQTADCLPVLLWAPEENWVAAVHAGWRGVWQDVIGALLREWGRLGADLVSLRAAVGPAIGPCCYQVSEDLAESFLKRFGSGCVSRTDRDVRLDLRFSAVLQLQEGGVSAGNIAHCDLCTACDRRFFSHRREAGVTGRQLSAIVCG